MGCFLGADDLTNYRLSISLGHYAAARPGLARLVIVDMRHRRSFALSLINCRAACNRLPLGMRCEHDMDNSFRSWPPCLLGVSVLRWWVHRIAAMVRGPTLLSPVLQRPPAGDLGSRIYCKVRCGHGHGLYRPDARRAPPVSSRSARQTEKPYFADLSQF